MPRSKREIIQEVVRLRKEQNISQQELADVIGLDQSTVNRIEKGQRGLAVAELADFAERLNTSMEALLRVDSSRVARCADNSDPQLKRAVKAAEKLADNFLYFKALTG